MVRVVDRLRARLRLRLQLEDRVLTRPSPLFRPAFPLDGGDEREARAAVAQLRETGAFCAGVRLSAAEIAALRTAIDEACAGRRPEIRVRHDRRTGNATILNALRLHPGYVALAADAFACGIAERYLRRQLLLADVDVRRVPPFTMTELDDRAGTTAVGMTSSHWHRDIRGRQVKVMIYLTDVFEGDSSFSYLPATHRGHHVRPRDVVSSRFTDAWVDESGITPIECYGAAGTVMVFDTNLIHRLRRRPTARVRDSVTYYYTPGQATYPLDVAERDVAALPAAAQALFRGDRPPAAVDHTV